VKTIGKEVIVGLIQLAGVVPVSVVYAHFSEGSFGACLTEGDHGYQNKDSQEVSRARILLPERYRGRLWYDTKRKQEQSMFTPRTAVKLKGAEGPLIEKS
jgi:hypothetical protein